MSHSQVSFPTPRPSDKLLIPELENFSLASLFIFLDLFQFFIFPIYFLPKGARWGYLLVPIAFTTTPLWALLHEAIHGAFNSYSQFNRAFGRLLAICFGSPFHVLRLTHLSHHKFNRSATEKGTEIYDPKKVSRFRASFHYFFTFFAGFIYSKSRRYLFSFCRGKSSAGCGSAFSIKAASKKNGWLGNL